MTLLQGSKMTGELHSRNSILSIMYLHFFHIKHIKWPNGTSGIVSGCGSQLFSSIFFLSITKTRLHNNRSSHLMCSIKKVFLELSQNSQESTCARVFFFQFLIKLQASNTFLTEHLWTTASVIGFFSKMYS